MGSAVEYDKGIMGSQRQSNDGKVLEIKKRKQKGWEFSG